MSADEGDAGSIPGGVGRWDGVVGEGREEVPLEKKVAIRSSILVWKSPWTEEPGGLQSMGSQECGIWLGDETATNCTLGSREIWLPEQLKWSFKICLVFFSVSLWKADFYKISVRSVVWFTMPSVRKLWKLQLSEHLGYGVDRLTTIEKWQESLK